MKAWWICSNTRHSRHLALVLTSSGQYRPSGAESRRHILSRRKNSHVVN